MLNTCQLKKFFFYCVSVWPAAAHVTASKVEASTLTVRKNSEMKKEFCKSLTNFYMNDSLSDRVLRIVEDTPDKTEKLNEGIEFKDNCF